MTLAPRHGTWEQLKPRLARWIPLFGYYTAQRIGKSCSHLRRGKIEPPASCEINAVDHCNLSCLDCNHASPAISKAFADPVQVFTDCQRLSRHYRPRRIKIAGGEPLMHPDFLELLRALLASGLSKRLYLITNGLLLEQMPEAAWELLDFIELSLYPQLPSNPDWLDFIRRKAAEHRIRLDIWEHKEFHAMFALRGTADENLVNGIYKTCWLAHVGGCHSVHQGYIYKCPQAIYIAKLIPKDFADLNIDGIRIDDSPGFFNQLREYLADESPLAACRYCLGNVGRVRSHQFVPPGEWLSHHDVTTDSLIDHERLQQIGCNPYDIRMLKKLTVNSSTMETP